MKRGRPKNGKNARADSIHELTSDPAFLQRLEERGDIMRDNVERYQRAARPLIDELAAHGFDIASIRDLRYHYQEYRTAVPVLLRWLPRVDYLPLKEDIVRTLSVPWAKPDAAPALIAAFRRSSEPGEFHLRWAIGNALDVVATEAELHDLLALAQDKRYGAEREMLMLALARIKKPGVVDALIASLDDPAVAAHAAGALGRLRARSAREPLERLAATSQGRVAKAAKLALQRIAKSRPS